MFYRSLLLGLLFISVTILSCSRSGNPADDDSPHVVNPNDNIAPVVEIYTPVADQLFPNGNTINITGKITDETALYRGSIRIVNDANGAVLREQAYEIHGLLSYSYNLPYTVTTTTAGEYTISVAFEDHGLNMTSKSVKVKVSF
jgi:hypothetical protein